MANDFTVSDILGKGFKYELRITEAAPPPQEGTIAALFGSAHWGPVNVTKFISSGKSEFNSIFGDVNSEYDEGHAAMQYHLVKSLRGYYTRITDGTDTKAFVKAAIAATAAVAVSTNSIAPSAIVLTPATNALNITIADSVPPYSHVLSVVFTGSALAEQAQVAKTGLGALAYAIGNQIVFTINGTPYTATVATAPFAGTGADFATLLTTGSFGGATVTWGPSNPAPGTVTFSGGATTFEVTSVGYGTSQTVVLTSDTGAQLTGATGANSDTGVNSNHASIISQINAAIPPAMLISYPGYVAAALGTGANLNKLVITSPTTGSTATITVSGTANAAIALPAGPTAGVALKYVGTFRAKQTGRLGNTIQAIVTGTISGGNQCDLYFNGGLIGTFVNFSYDSNLNNYLGTLVANDYFTKDIVEYNHAVDEADVALVPAVLVTEEIPAGTWTCASGTSGDSTVVASTDVVPQIAAMSNIDIYDFDIIAAPGYPEEEVQDALQAVCEKRQDAMTVWDTPLLTTPSNVVQWTNGLGAFGRNNKADTMFAAVYYPYIKCDKTVFDGATTNTKTVNDDYAPSIRVIGAIAQNDNILKSTFGAPAGVRTVFDGVTGLQKLLSEDDRTLLYADVYDGCVNPIAFTTEDGFFIDGQKSCARKDLAKNKVPKTSRLNAVRTTLFLKKFVQKRVKLFFYNPSDKTSWDAFKKMVESGLKILEEKRAIEGEAAVDPRNSWAVKCNQDTNTPQVIANNGLVCIAEFTIIESIERIKFIANLKERQLTIQVESI